MGKLSVLFLVFLMLFSSACGKINDEKSPSEISPSDKYAENETVEPNVSFLNGVLVVKYSGKADFSALSDIENREEAEIIEIYLETADEIIIPEFSGVKNLNIEITETAKSLDISALENLEQFALFGKAEELSLPANLESISVYGQTDLSLFAHCKSIKNVYILGVTNLEPLRQFENLESVFIMTGGCDLSPLNNVSFEVLRLSGVTDGDLAVINGCGAKTLQISDESISDLSIIERLPNLETLFFTVASGVNPYVTTFMEPNREDLENLETSADLSALEKFIENGGTVYLMLDPNR